jgi:hypothetical protein
VIGRHNLAVGDAERLQKLAHNGGGELGQAQRAAAVLGPVTVHQQPHQQVLLVGLQHHVGDGGGGAGHRHLEEVERLGVLLMSQGVADPDPDSESGSESKRAKMTRKSRQFFYKFMF